MRPRSAVRWSAVLVVLTVALSGCETEEDEGACALVQCSAGRCVTNVQGYPVCQCSLAEQLAGVKCERVTPEPQDDHGDTLADATLFQPSLESFTVDLTKQGDVDVLAFEGVAGHVYRFHCDEAPGLDSVHVELLDATGKGLTWNWVMSLMRQERLFEPTASGRYYTRLSPGYQGDRYTCRLEDWGEDDHGGSVGTGTQVALSVPFTVRAEGPAELDVLTFPAVAGRVYSVRLTAGQPTTPPLVMFLWEPDGSQVYGPGVESAPMVHKARRTGRYALWVRAPYPESLAAPRELVVEDVGTDDHGNTVAEATSLELGATTWGALYGAEDVDVFTVSATAGTVYRIRMDCASCEAQVSTASGHLKYDAGTGNGDSFVETEMTEPLAVKVSSRYGARAFKLQVEAVGRDDHGDDITRATPMELMTSVTSALELPTDVDVFSIRLEQGRTYHFDPPPPRSHWLEVRTAWDSTNLPVSPEGRFTGGASTTHFLALRRSASFDYTGPWTFQLLAE